MTGRVSTLPPQGDRHLTRVLGLVSARVVTVPQGRLILDSSKFRILRLARRCILPASADNRSGITHSAEKLVPVPQGRLILAQHGSAGSGIRKRLYSPEEAALSLSGARRSARLSLRETTSREGTLIVAQQEVPSRFHEKRSVPQGRLILAQHGSAGLVSERLCSPEGTAEKPQDSVLRHFALN